MGWLLFKFVMVFVKLLLPSFNLNVFKVSPVDAPVDKKHYSAKFHTVAVNQFVNYSISVDRGK